NGVAHQPPGKPAVRGRADRLADLLLPKLSRPGDTHLLGPGPRAPAHPEAHLELTGLIAQHLRGDRDPRIAAIAEPPLHPGARLLDDIVHEQPLLPDRRDVLPETGLAVGAPD